MRLARAVEVPEVAGVKPGDVGTVVVPENVLVVVVYVVTPIILV